MLSQYLLIIIFAWAIIVKRHIDDDVASIVAEVALAAPRNGIVEIGGPERAPFNEIVARYLKAVGDPRQVVRDPEARYFGGRVEERSLVPLGEARLVIRLVERLASVKRLALRLEVIVRQYAIPEDRRICRALQGAVGVESGRRPDGVKGLPRPGNFASTLRESPGNTSGSSA